MELTNKQIDRSTSCVKPVIAIRSALLSMVFPVCAILISCASGMRASSEVKDVDVSAIVSDPASYSGDHVRLHVCVNVTFHEVTLVACDASNPQINIDAGVGSGAEEAYLRLINFSHENMGREPGDLPVVVDGTYRSERAKIGYRHTLYVTGFQRSRKSN